MLRFTTAAIIAITCLALPGAASADSGAISSVVALSDGAVQATYTANADCAGDTSGYCFWFPYATQVAGAQACNPEASPIYVGDYGVHEGVGTETGTDFFYPDFNPVRLCLYIDYGDNDVLVGQITYERNATLPQPGEPEAPEEVAPMSVREAKGYVASILKKKYRRKFSRRTLRRSCSRWTTEKVRCNVSWRKGKFKYRGWIKMWNDPDAPEDRFIYSYKIKRKRIRSHNGGGGGSNCDLNYSGCLNPNASDYDCAGGSGDGPYYTGKVYVLGNDHYDLDRDGDGVACDDPSAFSAAVSIRDAVTSQRAAMMPRKLGKGARTWR
jgi:hypothetical protein